MKRYTTTIALALFLTLSGCAATLQDEAPDTPQGRLLALEADFNTAFEVMRTYEGLTRCDATEVVICSDQGVVDTMRTAVTGFDHASKTAWEILRNPGFEQGNAEYWISQALVAIRGAQGLIADLRKQGVIEP